MEGNITSHKETFGDRVITFVTFLVVGIAEKDAPEGFGVKFVGVMKVDI